MKRRPEYNMKLIGKNLKRLRERKKLSVDEVRKYLCLGSVQAVYKYESGKNYPPADALLALMELYGASVHDITREHDAEWYMPSVDLMFSELVSFDQARERQVDRLMKYYKFYKEIAG